MWPNFIALVLVLSVAVVSPAGAAQDLTIDQLATCKVSWLEAKNDPARVQKFGEILTAGFERKNNDPFLVPKARATAAGLPILRLFPESLGMGVGFSVVVAADFATTKKSLETAAGKSLTECETGDGMRSCSLELAARKTLTLMAAENGKAKETLFGCYYYYEK